MSEMGLMWTHLACVYHLGLDSANDRRLPAPVHVHVLACDVHVHVQASCACAEILTQQGVQSETHEWAEPVS